MPSPFVSLVAALPAHARDLLPCSLSRPIAGAVLGAALLLMPAWMEAGAQFQIPV